MAGRPRAPMVPRGGGGGGGVISQALCYQTLVHAVVPGGPRAHSRRRAPALHEGTHFPAPEGRSVRRHLQTLQIE